MIMRMIMRMRILCLLLCLPTRTLGFTLFTSTTSTTTSTTSTSTSLSSYAPFANYQSSEQQQQNLQSKIRPLHQNWWPCIIETNLDESRPNPLEVLGIKLVLWKSDGDWTCLEDKCSHRFAPLSEGRIVVKDERSSSSKTTSYKKACSTTILQCAYHGWEFNSYGRCQKVPQTGMATGAKPVPAYPVRVAAGMVWVYMDPSTPDIAGALPLPISPLLKRWHEAHGEGAIYMRDLPYGYELLGENLMDLSHLPYSHHALGSLTRDLGGPIPFQMLSSSQKTVMSRSSTTPMPLYQAKIVDASRNDPLFKSNSAIPENATSTVSFYEAAHVRYTRSTFPGQSSEVQLFLCPISPGKSRVFLANVFEQSLLAKETDLQAKNKKKSKTKQPTSTTATATATTSNWKQSLLNPKKAIMTRLAKQWFRPDGYRSHLFSNKLFDGDGLFLQLQGDRMQRAGLTYKDYATPASADILVNAFRRYLEAASEKTTSSSSSSSTTNSHRETMAEAANPKSKNSHAYTANLPRSVALDRFESHTSQCHICSAELTKRQALQKRLAFLQTAMTGAAGASTLSLLLLFLVGSEVAIPLRLLRIAVGATVATDLTLLGLHRSQTTVQASVDTFLFEDYVHADK